MLLGEMIAQVGRAGASGNLSAVLGDLPLMVRVSSIAAQAGMEPDDYILSAVRRFEGGAGPDDWVTLMGAASGEADAGRACLRRMVEWALRADSAAQSGMEGLRAPQV